MPLLLQALDLPDPDLRTNVINTLTLLTNQSPDAVAPHATTIVHSLLSTALDTSSTNTEARIASLKCLSVIPEKLQYLTLQSVKAEVIKELGKVLDDKKKQVRREGVDCRSKWYLLTG